MPEKCPHHDSLIEGQATIANELVHIKKEIQEFQVIMRGTNGISGMVGWFNQRKGEMKSLARVNGFIAGVVGAVIAIVMRAIVGLWTK